MRRKNQTCEARITRHLRQKICSLIAKGLNLESAASLAGVSDTTAREWLQNLPEFAMSVAQAEAKCQAYLLHTITQAAARGQWKAAAWLLERRWPDEFDKRDGHEVSRPSEILPTEAYIQAIRTALGFDTTQKPIIESIKGGTLTTDNGDNSRIQ